MRHQMGRCLLPDLLAKRGWSQRDLAEKSGFTQTQISDFATNRRTMSLPTAVWIAGALGCSVDDLYEGVRNDERG